MSERVAQMPNETVLTKRLAATPLPLKQEGVLRRFVGSIADQEESGATLVAAWESACEEANRKLPLQVDLAITRLLHAYAFPSVVDTVTLDGEVAAQAKEELKVLEATRS